jgi:shikimate dehydrogenase
MFEEAFKHHDLDWRYLTFEVADDKLADAVRGLRALGFRGGHCAFPYRNSIVPLLDRTTETASLLGCVSLFYVDETGWVGDNIDGRGVLSSIRREIDPVGKKVVLYGAGAMARAIAVELVTLGVASLTVVNRTDAHAADLVTFLANKFNAPAVAEAWQDSLVVSADADMVIHATSLGDCVLPLSPESLRPGLLVADVTPSPRTWLLDQAADRGCKTVDGLTMCIEEAAIGFELLTGLMPDRDVLREAVEEFWEL